MDWLLHDRDLRHERVKQFFVYWVTTFSNPCDTTAVPLVRQYINSKIVPKVFENTSNYQQKALKTYPLKLGNT